MSTVFAKQWVSSSQKNRSVFDTQLALRGVQIAYSDRRQALEEMIAQLLDEF